MKINVPQKNALDSKEKKFLSHSRHSISSWWCRLTMSKRRYLAAAYIILATTKKRRLRHTERTKSGLIDAAVRWDGIHLTRFANCLTNNLTALLRPQSCVPRNITLKTPHNNSTERLRPIIFNHRGKTLTRQLFVALVAARRDISSSSFPLPPSSCVCLWKICQYLLSIYVISTSGSDRWSSQMKLLSLLSFLYL